ncbi:hypothetical protein [Deinococcus actinosclerus]|nr:hypothetical protein [Deinococcus actinosclerus]
MQNEASSVNDREWAMETTQAARRFGWRGAGEAAAVFAALGVGMVLLGQFLWRYDAPDALWVGVMLLTGVAGSLLGARLVAALEAGAGALAFLPGAWLGVLGLQALLGDAAPFTPIVGVADADGAVLAVIAACAAGTTQRVITRRALLTA